MKCTQKSNLTSNCAWTPRRLHVCNDVCMDISMLSTALQEMCDGTTHHDLEMLQYEYMEKKLTESPVASRAPSSLKSPSLSHWRRVARPGPCLFLSTHCGCPACSSSAAPELPQQQRRPHRWAQTPTSTVETLVASSIFREPSASSRASPASQQRPPPASAKARSSTKR